MTETPSQDILIAPEYAILEFGDGYIALIQGGIEHVDDEGRPTVTFKIKPSDLLRKRYNIKDSMLNRNGVMLFKVYKKDLIPLNLFDDANRKWLYIKTFNHDETEVSNINWDLRKRLEENEKRIMVVEGENIWLSEQLQLAKTNPAEFIAQGTEVFERVISNLSELSKIKREKGES